MQHQLIRQWNATKKIKLWDENEEEDHSNDSREVHFKMYTNQTYYRYIKFSQILSPVLRQTLGPFSCSERPRNNASWPNHCLQI